ncbi:MAG: eukaryotic-like serine/threonine-protein kinase [Acidobacteriota bacterium]|jgi:tetratricopeptide (TPR) repeat protein/tRNA A-37 threonylcarbamoyl transferase component Bud32|nr:eukaryotic-like serine/threonine-protein kinase [Acidobacteriota bacterium]
MIGKNISRYRILGQVGEGGMGVVYVAEDTVLGRRVAVKIPHAGHDESHYRARFLREARAVSKLRHENIAAVHDFGETEEGQPFIVMELVSGQTLGDLLSGPGISVARAVEVARQTANALSEAHRLGVIHRDIKPSNIIIDDAGTVKVLDFGLAKQLHEEAPGGANGSEAQTLLTARTRSDVVIGTPLYLSPEQARGAKVDGRSDLFALGALLYECLTGRPAFSGANVIEIGAQVLHFDPPPPSRFNPRIPAELDRLTLKALAKKPEDRFQTAQEFAAELARVRSRLPDSDTVPTRRLAGADNGHRSSALITMAEGLRRPKFSPLTLVASLAALGLLIWLVAYLRRPPVHVPGPEVLALYQSGVAALREGAYYKASQPLQEAVDKDKEFVLAHARLAEALMEMDFLDRAKDEILDVGKRAPDFTVFTREDALYLEAVRSAVMQDFDGAVRGYQEIVNLDPTQPQAHLDLGRAYERRDLPEQALASYTEATTRDHSYAAAFLRLGALHARQLNLAGATVAFDSAQKLYADMGNREGEAAVHYQRGRLFYSLQKPAEARAEFGQALALARESDNKYQQVQSLLQLAQVITDGAEAEKTALDAVNLAQSTGMNDQLANGNLMLGNVRFQKLGNLDQAERDYQQALQIARNYKLRRYEALAYFNLAALRERQLNFDEADQYAERAREFFPQGGYRREADQWLMIAARIKKGRGDYDGAFKIFEELLSSAEQSGDMGQAGNLHRECGSVLAAQEKYPQALEHFREGANYAKTLHNATLLTYSLLNEANMLWALGRYDDAEDIYGQLTGADSQVLGVSKNVLAYIQIAEAEMELSRQHFQEAAVKSRRSLATFKDWGGKADDLLSEINSSLGQAEALSGARAHGRALCEEALHLASVRNDPSNVAFANLALATVLLEAGDAAGGRDAALRAQEGFAHVRRADFEWRALAMAGKASRRVADENAARDYLSRAAASLSLFKQSLGAEAAGYLLRPDVQRLRGDLGDSAASAAH